MEASYGGMCSGGQVAWMVVHNRTKILLVLHTIKNSAQLGRSR